MGKLTVYTCALAVACLVLSGCGLSSGKTTSFMREDIDLGFYQRIAVLSFENHTSDAFAADRLRDVVMTQLLASGYYDVVDKGLVDSVLLEEAVDKGAPIGKPALERLGQIMNVQGFIIGSVDESSDVRKGSFEYPQVSLTLRLVDAKSATVLWQASGHRNGYTLGGRLFGAASRDKFQVSMDLVDELLATGVTK